MWDLDSIIRQNNQANLSWMMQGQQVEEARQPTPKVWPLSLLAQRLSAGPPLISEIITSLENIDAEKAFLSLVTTFLPGHEEEIMLEPRNKRVYLFGYLFGEEYYPLALNTECGMRALITGMPVDLLAMSYSAYHDLDMRPGYILLLSNDQSHRT